MKEHTINITRKITDDDLVGILCGVTGSACVYWCDEIIYNQENYKRAKQQLIDTGAREIDICYEDVILQLLKNGDTITFYSSENEEEYSLSCDLLIKGIERYMSSNDCEDIDIDMWDDEDYDAVIQYALFNEFVYG